MNLWRLEETGTAARLWGAAACAAAVALQLLLQEVGLRLRREEHRAWWAGSGRDLLNAAGFAAIAGALRLYGFPAPAALLAGGTLTLLLFGIHVFLTTRMASAHPRALALFLGLALALAVLAWPSDLLAALGGAVARLFPAVAAGPPGP